MRKKIQIGTIFEIPLGKKRGFLQYVYLHLKQGQLVKVFNVILDKELSIDSMQIVGSDLLFPPVLTSVTAAIKTNQWKIIGHAPVKKFTYPSFVSTFYDHATGKARQWYLITEDEEILLGTTVPKKYQHLEFLAVYSPDLIAKRIESGKKPYESLITTNTLQDPVT